MALLDKPFAPNRERIQKIKQWHIDQAIAETQPVAALHVCITADNRVVTHGVCIEEEHAQVFIAELHAIIARIESQLPKPQAALKLVRTA